MCTPGAGLGLRSRPHRVPLLSLMCSPMCSFLVCTALYGGMAIMGFCMFGQDLQSQITLNLPSQLAASKLAIWTTVRGAPPRPRPQQAQGHCSSRPMAVHSSSVGCSGPLAGEPAVPIQSRLGPLQGGLQKVASGR